MNTTLTKLPFGLAGNIYRSPMPFGYFDPQQVVLDNYQQAGVGVVVMLVSDEEAYEKTGLKLRDIYRAKGVEVIYLPIADFNTPSSGVLLKGLRQVQAAALAGRNVAVHCNAGIGRTGLFMACLARQIFGMPGEQAITWVQQYIEHAVETEQQYSFVQSLELDECA